MSKSLRIIQTVMKILNILIKIAFVFTIVGAVLCAIAAGYVLSANGGAQTILDFEVEGRAIKFIIMDETGADLATVGAGCVAAAILCAGSAVQVKMQSNYFVKEVEDGTPFTFEGADALKKAAINSLIACIITIFAAGITFGVMTMGNDNASFDAGSGLIFSPLTMLFASVIFRYGAEQRELANKQ